MQKGRELGAKGENRKVNGKTTFLTICANWGLRDNSLNGRRGLERMQGSFDCVVVRFAHDNFAQDDSVLSSLIASRFTRSI